MAGIPASSGHSVRIGYARVSTRAQDRQAQLDALAAAHCREVVVETASTGDGRPKLRSTLAALQAGDTLVICKPDRAARSMKELLPAPTATATFRVGMIMERAWMRRGISRPGPGPPGWTWR